MKRLNFLVPFCALALLGTTVQSQTPPEQTPEPARGAARSRIQERLAQAGERAQAARQRTSLAEELGLSDVQKADIRKSVETARRERLRKTTDLRIASMDLRSLMRADKVDDKAIAAKLAEIQAAQGALLKLRVDTALAMKKVLTPEQQNKAAELKRHRGRGPALERRRGGGRRGPGFRGGRAGRGGDAFAFDELDLDTFGNDDRGAFAR